MRLVGDHVVRSESYERGCAPARYRGGVADQRKNFRRSSTRRSPSGGSGRAADRTSRAAGATSSNNASSRQRTAGTAASAWVQRSGTKSGWYKAAGNKGTRYQSASRRSKRTSSGGPRPPVNLWPRRIITGLGLRAPIVWGRVVARPRCYRRIHSIQFRSPYAIRPVGHGRLRPSLKGGQEVADGLLTDGTAIEFRCAQRHRRHRDGVRCPVGSPLYVPVTLGKQDRSPARRVPVELATRCRCSRRPPGLRFGTRSG